MTIPLTTDLTTLHRAPENWKPPSSQAEFDALAAEAEQDLLRVAFPEPLRGRPKTGDRRSSTQTAIRLPEPLMKALKAKAVREHRALNAVIRDACIRYVQG